MNRTLTIALAYQVVPIVLVVTWIMPEFFDLFGVSWSDRSWRMYAATAGGWALMELPLVAFIVWQVVRAKCGGPNA